MAKVFRIHKGASNTISNWEDSVRIGTTAIDSIEDPVGATDKKEITSIPSPFARMDLVKRAFKYVAEHGLDGKTAYHKLVSDSLDGAVVCLFGDRLCPAYVRCAVGS